MSEYIDAMARRTREGVREGEEAVLKVLAARNDREEQARVDAKQVNSKSEWECKPLYLS